MKEKIYTIPLTEAYEEPSECPFCKLEKKLEEEAGTHALGASMMEPDSRIVSNEKGFCRRHFTQMTEQKGSALSLALVLDTHINCVIEKMERAAKKKASRRLWRKEKRAKDELCEFVENTEHTCLICDKIESTLEKFACTFWELYHKEPEFYDRVNQSKGFCLPHFAFLLKMAEKELSGSKKEMFKKKLTEVQLQNMKRINEDVHWFTQKFDYRNQEASWKTSKDAPARAIEKLVKYMDKK